MRKILKDTCIFAALMILIIFTFSIAEAGFTDEIKLVFEIFGLALLLSVFNYFFDEKTSFSMLVSYLIKYVVISIMVIVFGFIVGWFYPVNYWMAFIYVGVITVIVFALDSVKTEKDIEEINDMVKISKEEKVEIKPLRKRGGWKVILFLLISMIVLFVATVIGYSETYKYNANMRKEHKAEAVAEGYDAVYTSCKRQADVVLDGTRYECYSCVKVLFAGDISTEDILLYVDKDTGYIDGTGGETEGLTIYCKDLRFDGHERYIEPYSIYNAGKTRLENYFINGLIVSALAVSILTLMLAVYMIVYHIRRKKKL